ncbi:hypothetical protein B0H66DRAFT_539300 [Apodospora peruviana]|uniref:Uncharacterized protein n=1 Tax=Apodospora peruviana TaxID=516989 RepID=A0AAE0ME03_9PEZI|nr:hypothetical protein B0H66DRAFT_539300 [Apodospora peruviana]
MQTSSQPFPTQNLLHTLHYSALLKPHISQNITQITMVTMKSIILLALSFGSALANPLAGLAVARQESAAAAAPTTAAAAAKPTSNPCDRVRCAGDTTCQVVNGKAKCVKGTPCGPTTCAAGTSCCNASCGICVKPGMMCSMIACEPAGVQCGPNVCASGQECCNESCGICTEKGGFCTQQFCVTAGPKCGTSVCPTGTTCCNSSCGVCVPPGGACTQQICPASE